MLIDGIAASLLAMVTPSARIAQSSPAEPVIASPASGKFFIGSSPLVSLDVEHITWTGDCPGDQTQGYGPVEFLADNSPPAPGQRVLIRNLNTGGFTDRKYGEGRIRSEGFYVSIGQGQHGSYLSLSPGVNSLSWSISNPSQSQIIATGSATLSVNVVQTQRNRSFLAYREDTYCLGEKNKGFRTALDKCPDGYYTLERIGVCPNGTTRVLTLETLRRANSQLTR
jgi:hypothetical protein